MIVVYTLLFIAVSMDLRSMKISNRLIFIGLAISLTQRVFTEGMGGFLSGLILISLPVILLYLLFLVGALGAGDIKLFSLIGGFVNLKELMWCIVFAFIFGGLFSLGKMLYYRVFFSSIQNAIQYFVAIFHGDRTPYQPRSMKKGRIHFSLAILFGLVATNLYL